MKRYLLALLFLAGCASAPGPYNPVVDGRLDPVDLAECRALSLKVDRSKLGVIGAVGGYDDLVTGVQQRQAVIMCLNGRGYRVLG